MDLFQTYKGLPKSVYIIFIAQIINRFGDFVMPFLSLLLVKNLGLSFQIAGIALTLTSLSSVPGSLICGKASDHFGRIKVYAIAQSSAAIFIFLCVLTRNPYFVIGLICCASFFNGGIRPTISAILTDVLTTEQRQLGFSLSYMGINIGVAVGPIVAGFLFTHSIPLMFICDTLTSLLAVSLVVKNIPETKPDYSKQTEVTEAEQTEHQNMFIALWKRPQLLWFFILNILIASVYMQSMFSAPVMLTNLFGIRGAAYYGTMMSVNGIVVVIGTLTITPYIRKWQSLNSVACGTILYALGFGMIGFIQSYSLFLISTVIWTFGEIMISTNFGVYIANNTPQNFRGRFNAFSSMSYVAGAMIGTAVMGRYIDRFGVNAVWPLCFVLASLAAAGTYMLHLKYRQASGEILKAES